MPNTREKLSKLLGEAHRKSTEEACFNDATYAAQLRMEADHLIANGVTFPVRCKDCKHWQDIGKGCTDHVRCCEIGFYMIGENGYCYFGERSAANENL